MMNEVIVFVLGTVLWPII